MLQLFKECLTMSLVTSFVDIYFATSVVTVLYCLFDYACMRRVMGCLRSTFSSFSKIIFLIYSYVYLFIYLFGGHHIYGEIVIVCHAQ